MRRMALAVVAAIATVAGAQSATAVDCLGIFGCGDQPCDAAGCRDMGCEVGCELACEPGCDDMIGCDSCGACGQNAALCSCLGDMKLLGCLKPSDRCFDDFISPMINFVHFEDPRTLTEVRPIFLHHNVPDATGGGHLNLWAMQFRIALSERLSIIAVKDGYVVNETEGLLDTVLSDGWAAVTAGLKYNVLRDVQSGTLASVGATYELPVGSRRTLQDVGDGEFHLFATGGQRLLDGNAHYLTSFGWRVPTDGFVQNELVHWSNHLDFKLTEKVYFLTELAWWHVVESAEAGLPLGIFGQDLFNLPTTETDDLDLVTQNVGLKYKPNRNVEAGIAYEFPLTSNKDVIDNRLQLEFIYRY